MNCLTFAQNLIWNNRLKIIDTMQSLIGAIKPLINSLRHVVSESTLVFYSSLV